MSEIASAAQMSNAAVLNQKLLLVDTGTIIAATPKYVGMRAYPTDTSGGLTALHLYIWNGSSFKDYGVGT